MIVFKNEGEIDIRSITTFGVSVKVGTNPIGYFGTGLKYAIAVLLRNNHKVSIYSGESVYEFGIDRSEVRGQEFEFVTVKKDNGDPVQVGFTTQLGKNWELWMAYREIACNCKDESGDGSYEDNAPSPEQGNTFVVVTGREFETIYANRQLYILEDNPDFVSSDVEIRLRPTHDYFYRGIRVSRLDHHALFTYNDLAQLDLTEDRTAKYPSYIGYHVVRAIAEATDKKFIKACVLAPDGTYESGLNYANASFPSQEFLDVVGECIVDRMCKINQSAVKLFRDTTKSVVQPHEITLSRVQLAMVEKALDFTENIGFSIRNAYPIKFVESMGDGVLGLAQDETIFIAERVFHMGTKQMASALIEEYIHLKHGYHDMTRELQTFLFDKIVSLGEEINGEPL